MDKQETARPDRHQVRPKNDSLPSSGPEDRTRASIAAAHSTPRAAHDPGQNVSRAERRVSRAYSLGDNDLARDNLENDLPDADLQDL